MQLLSPRASTAAGRAPRAYALQQEKTLQREAHVSQQGVDPTGSNLTKPMCSKTQH